MDTGHTARDPVGRAIYFPGRNGITTDLGDIGVLDRAGLDARVRGHHGLACLRREAPSAANLRLRADCSRTCSARRDVRIRQGPSGYTRACVSRCRRGGVAGIHAPTARKRSVAASGDGLDLLWSAVVFVAVYAASEPSSLARASVAELLFQSLSQGLLVSVVAVFAFNRGVASLGPKAAAAVIALVPVTVAVFAIPILDEFPSASSSVVIMVIAAGVMLAVGSSQSISTKGENA